MLDKIISPSVGRQATHIFHISRLSHAATCAPAVDAGMIGVGHAARRALLGRLQACVRGIRNRPFHAAALPTHFSQYHFTTHFTITIRIFAVKLLRFCMNICSCHDGDDASCRLSARQIHYSCAARDRSQAAPTGFKYRHEHICYHFKARRDTLQAHGSGRTASSIR